ncbi:MAG: peptidase D-aminopeptidase [Paenibacillus sp.]|nr:peptidase D-aminopeptidase [Paenibacillus sp.]
MTDLEGAAGVDSFSQTRTQDTTMKGPGMKQLAREVNACVEGIKAVDPEAVVDVIDGHGTGGLFPEDLIGCQYLRWSKDYRDTVSQYTALLYVGQHAMAGTIDAPLCHTYSSLSVQYYRLNDVYIGEFAAFANWCGLNGVPTILLAGDDKAALEAKMFVPQIETAVTKLGKGIEAAEHLHSDEACRIIREGAVRAMQRLGEIPPLARFQPPYVFEARNYEPIDTATLAKRPNARLIDSRTYRIETSDYRELPFF